MNSNNNNNNNKGTSKGNSKGDLNNDILNSSSEVTAMNNNTNETVNNTNNSMEVTAMNNNTNETVNTNNNDSMEVKDMNNNPNINSNETTVLAEITFDDILDFNKGINFTRKVVEKDMSCYSDSTQTSYAFAFSTDRKVLVMRSDSVQTTGAVNVQENNSCDNEAQNNTDTVFGMDLSNVPHAYEYLDTTSELYIDLYAKILEYLAKYVEGIEIKNSLDFDEVFHYTLLIKCLWMDIYSA